MPCAIETRDRLRQERQKIPAYVSPQRLGNAMADTLCSDLLLVILLWLGGLRYAEGARPGTAG